MSLYNINSHMRTHIHMHTHAHVQRGIPPLKGLQLTHLGLDYRTLEHWETSQSLFCDLAAPPLAFPSPLPLPQTLAVRCVLALESSYQRVCQGVESLQRACQGAESLPEHSE